MKLSKFLRTIENQYLLGSRIEVGENQLHLYKLSPRLTLSAEDNGLSIKLSLLLPTLNDENEAKSLLTILEGAGLAVGYEELSDEGLNYKDELTVEITLPEVNIEVNKITIAGVVTYQYTLSQDGSFDFNLILTFGEQRKLHGLSLYSGIKLTPKQITKVLPYIFGGDYGEYPVVVEHTTKHSQIRSVIDVNFKSLEIKDDTILIRAESARYALQLKGLRGDIKIADTGYVFNIYNNSERLTLYI